MQRGKIGDWVHPGRRHTVLLECKSLRPSLKLTTYGSDDSVEKLTERIALAVEQLIGHASSIQNGTWKLDDGLVTPYVCVVVTYGRVNTVNLPFTRRRIRERLASKGLQVPPFVVLSLEEMDIAVRLVENGHSLDDVVFRLALQEDGIDIEQLFSNDLKNGIVSSFSRSKGQAFLEGVRRTPAASPLAH